MKSRCVPILLGGCLVLLLTGHWARGQAESATLLGTVRTEDGAPAGNVEISIRRPATNESYSLLTGPGGNYRRDSLAAGDYEIQVGARGYAGQLRIGVQLLVGQALREDFVLTPGDENEVRVQESGWVPSGSDRDDRGLVIDQEKLETLPVASRDIGQLVDMAPGAARTSSGRRRGVKVMGMRRRDNLLYIDGTLFTHGDGGTSLQASTDALQEFDIKSGLYSAEYGIRPGAQIVAVTKSGTNAYHGSLYWFHRNDNLDARNFFEQEKKEFKRNQMGATLGGPILLPGLFKGTDRAWFFVSHQHRSIR
ncbi:MAG: carboxypeptidase regulatory-like domain-containing protein, partial [Candidatus Aminicenantes bacterium]|nr:carboxypeptidase regulatory-like domain-containing protein [Candidatus Aminicenantes bacterium]